ncbi:hypothetical protein AAVH_06656 [Aphelenchoides avenae]|nr:hypothetical protein AAVH_06656 [Aphelenchus avenae]
MELEAEEEYPAFAIGQLRGLEEELDESLEEGAFEKPEKTPQNIEPAEGSAMSDVPTASGTNCPLTALSNASSTSSGEGSKDGDEEVGEYAEALSEDLSRRIADEMKRTMNELQSSAAASSSTPNAAVKEEPSWFDTVAWPGLEEELGGEPMEMDSYEYDEASSQLRKSPATGNEASQKTTVPYCGLLALCNGYRMRSCRVNKKGEISWRCAKQSNLKFSGAARSGLDAANLIQIRSHNHRVSDGHPTIAKTARKSRSEGHVVGRSRKQKQPSDCEHVPRRQGERRAKADANKLMAQIGDDHDDGEVESPPALGATDVPTQTVQPGSSVWNFKSREAMRNPDVVLHVTGSKLYAHKAILAAISPVFDEAFRRCVGPMIDYNVNSNCIGPHGLEAFLQSIYPCGSEPTDDYLPQLAVLANHYDIKPLKRKCLERVKVSRKLSKLEKLMVAVKSDAIELEDQVLASFTKDDIRQLLQSEYQHQLGAQRLLKLLAKSVSL